MLTPKPILLVAALRDEPIAIHRYLDPRPPHSMDLLTAALMKIREPVRLERNDYIDRPVFPALSSNTINGSGYCPRPDPPKGRAPFRKFMR